MTIESMPEGARMEAEFNCPAHVPQQQVREFAWDYAGPLDGLFSRIDSLQVDDPVVWLQPDAAPGAWFLTQPEAIRRAFREPLTFSNQFGGDDVPQMIPSMMDPPEHTLYRRHLQPLFSKSAVAGMEDSIRHRFRRLVSNVVEQGTCEFVDDIAIHYPTGVFIDWIGEPEDKTSFYVSLVGALIHGKIDERTAALGDLYVALELVIDARMATPGDDLLSNIARIEIDGKRFSKDELVRVAFVLVVAGLDTVVAALSMSIAHLASVRNDRRTFMMNSVSADQAVEELLRRHSFVTVPRVLSQDVVIDGVRLKAGDPLNLSTTLASRDPDALACPYEVDFTRDAPHNYAFGLGSHFCLGAHLARLEMRIALEEWHAAIPHYELAGEPEAYGGIVMGLSHLPLRWDSPAATQKNAQGEANVVRQEGPDHQSTGQIGQSHP